jgi:hypothetical protein
MEVAWPAVAAQVGEPAAQVTESGELIIVRPRAQPLAFVRFCHRSETCVFWKSDLLRDTTAAVQLANPTQYGEFAPPRALSKNGCVAGDALEKIAQ